MKNATVQVQNAQIIDFTRFRRCLEEGYDQDEARRQAMGTSEPKVLCIPDLEEREQEARLKKALEEEHRRMREDEYVAWEASPAGRRVRRHEVIAWVLDIFASVGVAAIAIVMILQNW